MKCSHGLPYEVKCSLCFKEAMERVSAMKKEPIEPAEPFTEEWDRFWVGCYNQVLDTNPKV
jgi:hypothetical protein